MEFTDLPEKYKAVFDQKNANWTRDRETNLFFLFAVQRHMNNLLQMRSHVFLNEVYDALNMPRTYEGQVVGWLWRLWPAGEGDGFIDFGPSGPLADDKIELEFNVDGLILDHLPRE